MRNQNQYYRREWMGACYSHPRLRKNSRRMAVSQVESGSTFKVKVWREPGCTWQGSPVYQTDRAEYAVGRTKKAPQGAVRIAGTPFWVLQIRVHGIHA
ncbi:MAG: hypothetical protein GY799_25325 [Desulfobulbaceae bacterium]|nr:hypothetical protein [Desulfobulbaceae bacterium]